MFKLKTLSAMTLGAMLALPAQSASLADTPLYLKIDQQAVSDALRLQPSGSAQFKVTTRLEKGTYQIQIADKAQACGTTFGPEANKPLPFGTPNVMSACAKDGHFQLRVLLAGDYDFTLDNGNPNAPTLKVLRATKKGAFKRQPPAVDCASWDGKPVTVNVAKTWPNGTLLRDAYSGQTAKVTGGKITMTPAPQSEGILLLEEAKPAAKVAFSWDNAIVYFMLTDRFNNGDPSNDNSFGRQKDGKDEIGTWHGGDFKGITEKLDYLKDLGINAIWITPMVEQVHGYIGGGADSSFPFYAYHGYWALDFTKIDPNYGDEAALQTMVDEAHKRGIRILLDVVMNHAGYATLADLQDVGLESLAQNTQNLPARWADWRPKGKYEGWGSVSQFFNYQSPDWVKWWGPDWVRAELPGYSAPGTGDITGSVGGLPDFKTESTKYVDLPYFLKHKADTNAKSLPNATVVDYLVKWHSDWVRKFGIDGFRGDTVKHVEPQAWAKLKAAGTEALKEWRAANPDKKIDDAPFFMVGEVWDHGMAKDFWFDNGMDSLINFDYQRDALEFAQCLSKAEATYVKYAGTINKDPNFNVLSYISSHDTKLFFGDYQDVALQRRAANGLMLLPGGVQIYYGDESGRGLMKDGGVFDQAIRSDMNWSELASGEKAELVAHWQKLGQFRQAHPAIATGSHQKISDKPYAFVRQKDNDKVLVVFAGRQG
ncbi:MAG: alpha-amylase [Aeromonadaceae bacterium]|nr:alpha-amylase [Aeromonadaceae bacterium]